MNEEFKQDAEEELSPEDAKASLGLATRLGDQFLASQMELEAPQEGEIVPEQAEPQEDPNVAMEEFASGLTEEMDSFKKEVAKMIKDEIGGLKDEIKDALEDEE